MKAIINTLRCPMMLHPALECELADEALLGDVVEIDEVLSDQWYRVTTMSRYSGYVQPHHLIVGDGQVERWCALPKQVVLQDICEILAAPRIQSWPLATATRGAILAVTEAPSPTGWQRVSLPDGREGYTKVKFLGTYHQTPSFDDETALRQAVMATAMTYLGNHYRWGGKTPLGIDCSGLTSMSYLLNGIRTYRDAAIVEGFPVHPIEKSQLKPADLIYFPGHIALYLGDDNFIHATAHNGDDGVVVSSLNPSHPDYRPDLAETITAYGSVF